MRYWNDGIGCTVFHELERSAVSIFVCFVFQWKSIRGITTSSLWGISIRLFVAFCRRRPARGNVYSNL